jgi:hypothetical protein
MYVCKLYANGVPEQTVTFETLVEAELWACENARVVPETGTRFTVSIYTDTSAFPLAIVLE